MRGTHGERGAYDGGLGAESPARSRGKAAGQRVRVRSPSKVKILGIEMSNRCGIFGPFGEFWELNEIHYNGGHRRTY